MGLGETNHGGRDWRAIDPKEHLDHMWDHAAQLVDACDPLALDPDSGKPILIHVATRALMAWCAAEKQRREMSFDDLSACIYKDVAQRLNIPEAELLRLIGTPLDPGYVGSELRCHKCGASVSSCLEIEPSGMGLRVSVSPCESCLSGAFEDGLASSPADL
jgi:hypothetical protein